MKIEEAKPGVRVKYAKGTIVDVPKGRGGEIVGLTRGPQVKRADEAGRGDDLPDTGGGRETICEGEPWLDAA